MKDQARASTRDWTGEGPPTADRTVAVAPGPDVTAEWEFTIVFGAWVGVCAAGVLSQSLLAYLLLPEGRGAYAICVTFAYLLSVACTLSVERGAQYYVMAKRLDSSRGVSLSLTACLIGSAVAVAVALPLIHSSLAFFQKAETHSFHLSLALVPLTSISMAIELHLAALRRFAPLALCLSVQCIVMLLATVVLVWGLGLGVEGAILALAVGRVVMIATCFRDLRRNCGLALEMPSLQGFRQTLGYGLKYHVMRVGNEIEQRMGVFALGMMTGRADIGLFAAASTIMFQLNVISSAVGTVAHPRVAGGMFKRPEEMVGFCLRLVCLATSGVLVALLAISTPLVRILLSDAFVEVVPLMWILAPGVFAYAAAGMFVTYFSGVNRPGVCSRAVWLGLSANAASFLALHSAIGVEAAAWAMTIGLLVRTAYLAIVFHWRTGATLHSIWLPRRDDFAYLWAWSLRCLRPVLGERRRTVTTERN